MTEDVSIAVDSSVYDKRIADLSSALGQDGSDTVRDETRLFLKAAIKISPPNTRQQGERAVVKDLKKIIAPVSDGFVNFAGHNLEYIARDFEGEAIRHWLTSKKDGTPYLVEWGILDQDGSKIEDWHKRHLRPNGRTFAVRSRSLKAGAWFEPFVTTQSEFDKYAALVMKKVGTQKAAWAQSFISLAGKVPNWIQRNISRNKGEFRNSLNTHNPSVTMISRADGVGEQASKIRAILRIRQNAIARRIRLIVRGYSSDIVKKLKVEKKAFTTPESLTAE